MAGHASTSVVASCAARRMRLWDGHESGGRDGARSRCACTSRASHLPVCVEPCEGLGDQDCARAEEMCETLERAVSEANDTGFVLFELVALRDLHGEVQEGGRADARVRLGTVIDRMETTTADVQQMLDGSELDAAKLVAEARRAASS